MPSLETQTYAYTLDKRPSDRLFGWTDGRMDEWVVIVKCAGDRIERERETAERETEQCDAMLCAPKQWESCEFVSSRRKHGLIERTCVKGRRKSQYIISGFRNTRPIHARTRSANNKICITSNFGWSITDQSVSVGRSIRLRWISMAMKSVFRLLAVAALPAWHSTYTRV